MEVSGLGLLGVSLASYTLGYVLCWHTWRKDRAVVNARVEKAQTSVAEAHKVMMEQRDVLESQRQALEAQRAFITELRTQVEGMQAQRNAVGDNLRFERELHEQTTAKLQAALSALRRIGLGAQNSMTSKEDLGREARKATADE